MVEFSFPGFDPTGFSKAGNATCPFCGTVADNAYVKAEGCAGRMGTELMAVICVRPGARGKVYLSVEQVEQAAGLSSTGQRPVPLVPSDEECRQRIAELCQRTGLTVPDEPPRITVTDPAEVEPALRRGLKSIRDGVPAVISVWLPRYLQAD